MFISLLLNILLVFMICPNVAFGGMRINEKIIDEIQISEECFEIGFKGEVESMAASKMNAGIMNITYYNQDDIALFSLNADLGKFKRWEKKSFKSVWYVPKVVMDKTDHYKIEAEDTEFGIFLNDLFTPNDFNFYEIAYRNLYWGGKIDLKRANYLKEMCKDKNRSKRVKSENPKSQNAGSPNNERFRNLDWGMSIEEVVKAEGMASVNKMEKGAETNDEAIYFSDVVGGVKTKVLMYFSENMLIAGTYVFLEQHSFKNKYIEDFNIVEKILLKKYGAASNADKIWKNSLYKNDPGEYGFAVSLGHLEYKTSWDTNNNLIFHDLVGDNYNIEHLIYYYSKKYKSRIESRKPKYIDDF